MLDFDSKILGKKVSFFCDFFANERKRWEGIGRPKNLGNFVDRTIKWTTELEAHLMKGTAIEYEESRIVPTLYRPFVKPALYFAEVLTHRRYQLPRIFPSRSEPNKVISFLSIVSTWSLAALATDVPFDYCLLKQGNGATQALPLWTYEAGNRVDNITDWALRQFTAHYADDIGKGKTPRIITKEAIFHYCYAVLHDPLYREKYAQNLKREFPRIPFYLDFWQWAAWGEALMALHIGYETVKPFALSRTDEADAKVRAAGLSPKALLRSDMAAGTIALDSETTLRGIPAQAWHYKLGNRCAIDWVLDQYKEKKPKDPTIREKFNTYRFADYKEKVIDLLMRVTTVSVETCKVVEAMNAIKR